MYIYTCICICIFIYKCKLFTFGKLQLCSVLGMKLCCMQDETITVTVLESYRSEPDVASRLGFMNPYCALRSRFRSSTVN